MIAIRVRRGVIIPGDRRRGTAGHWEVQVMAIFDDLKVGETVEFRIDSVNTSELRWPDAAKPELRPIAEVRRDPDGRLVLTVRMPSVGDDDLKGEGDWGRV